MRKQILTFALTMMLMLAASVTFAQPPQCDGDKAPKCPLNLTEQQSKQIKQLGDDAQKKIFQIELQIKEKKAHLDVLRYADKPDMNAINATIDEIARLKADKKKVREANFQEIRQTLTDEQRVIFDTKHGKCCGIDGCGKDGKHGGKHGKHGDRPEGFGQPGNFGPGNGGPQFGRHGGNNPNFGGHHQFGQQPPAQGNKPDANQNNGKKK